ncbi:hypothetical protein FNU76_02445 [Chitinimonas arctica]|uniref:RiboL-PSP-HEPN domain-containing protein n=1 Tax=Chitinimonas arctica TaxID=2594795 RepID=A0A516SAX9_9NEIS|nr:hypothetical protein [Chitinimonas arctica]QDQ25302.1 hypothetical protein FNU76_02445 [Chitinimonas arctica]
MRDLKLPALYKGHPLFTLEEDFDEAREIRRMSGRIISATSAIDQVIAGIIADTIFREVKEYRELVFGSVLSSDWCSLAAKRKLLSIAVEQFDLLSGSKKGELEKSLKKVTQYRNAFAHGTLGHNVTVQELHYFEGSPRRDILDEPYFDELERHFLTAWTLLGEVQLSIKATA